MKKYKDLEPLVLDYAYENDKLSKDNLLGYNNRVLRDIEGLHLAIRMKSLGRKEMVTYYNKITTTEEEIRDRMGKILFNLIILAEINDVSLEEVLEQEYKNIK